jgi:hypothetical protein
MSHLLRSRISWASDQSLRKTTRGRQKVTKAPNGCSNRPLAHCPRELRAGAAGARRRRRQGSRRPRLRSAASRDGASWRLTGWTSATTWRRTVRALLGDCPLGAGCSRVSMPFVAFHHPRSSARMIAPSRGCRRIPGGCTKVTTAFWGDLTGARQAADAELPRPKWPSAKSTSCH